MHRWSQLFIPTLREAPADAEVASHKFLVRSGYIRQLAAGVYSYTFLGQRSLLKIIGIVRQEMDKIGQEFYLPAIHPREIWEASGRWAAMGETMFHLQDRGGRDLCLGMTHEEVMTDIARKELRSYKQLPQIWYQIQSKFRDELRPKAGLLRTRQFTMKDAYSFDLDAAGLDLSYQKHYQTYRNIFDRCGLTYVVVDADSGAMGGSQSNEFMVLSDAGEDVVVKCGRCDYAANLQKATSTLKPVENLPDSGDGGPQLVETVGMKTIADVGKFLKVSPQHEVKTLAYLAVGPVVNAPVSGKQRKSMIPVVALLRGDHTLNETKLLAELPPGSELRPMTAEEIKDVFGGAAGSIGPVGLEPTKLEGSAEAATNSGDGTKPKNPVVLADLALRGRKNLIAGANKDDHHLKNITPERDFEVSRWADLRAVEAGEGCPRCGQPLEVGKAVEIGHIFKLGYKYSESMGARVLDQSGKEVTVIMGSYGIGMERILAASIEQNHDSNGFWLPPQIAPFEIVVTPTNVSDSRLLATAVQIAETLAERGFDVLLDDRDERAGVKFKDADLIGIPFRINVGKKVSGGQVEVFRRSTAESQDANIGEIADLFRTLIAY